MNTTTENETLSPMQMEILKKWKSKQNLGVSQTVKDELAKRFDGEVLYNEPMSRHTYIKIGGKAEVYLKPKTKDALMFAVTLANEHSIPYMFHGSGANTLVKDGGVRGFVISVYDSFNDMKVLEKTENHIDIYAESGVSWVRLMHLSRDEGAADLAPLTGIPGSLGGLVMMNAGTRVREMKDVIREITIITKDGEIKTMSREKLDFEYRNLKIAKTNFILSAVLRLTDLMNPDDVAAMIKQYQKKRTDTQPLEYPNLGSIFRNPTPTSKTEVVATAGQLIEEAGLKNVRVGGARISPKHANFIINEDNATAKDVLSLVSMIKDRVKQMSGVVLETEIKVIGEDE